MPAKTPATSVIAMLRGVNVGGKTVSMERLRHSLAALGFENVRTDIQSGNCLFNVRRVAPDLSKKIEEAIFRDFHLPVTGQSITFSAPPRTPVRPIL
jgi:uncharacterized protein (DUF1697 family)